MARHVIIGKGNLGLDLQAALIEAGHDVVLLTRSEGFSWPQSKTKILELQPEGVWVAAGHGSVEQCRDDFEGALKTHVDLPVELAQCLPAECTLGLFSTDYVANESDPNAPAKSTQRPKSLYACTKLWMEQAIFCMGRGNTAIFRIGSVYGNHFPAKTFPGKVRHRNPTPCEVTLPQNWVVPTPSWWIAETIVKCLGRAFNPSGPTIHHVGPAGGCTLVQWGKIILGDGYTVKSRGFDETRPAHSKLGCSLLKPEPKWDVLWAENLRRAQSVAGQRSSGL